MDEKKTPQQNNTPVKKPAPPPMVNSAPKASTPKVQAANTPKAPAPKAPANKDNKKLLKILIPVIAVLVVVVAVIVAFSIKGKKPSKDNTTTATTANMFLYVTDYDGVAVTDDSGMAVTVLMPNVTAVPVTDKKGETVTQQNGEVVTTLIHNNNKIPTKVVPVTNSKGEEVTNSKGEVQTTVYLPEVEATVNIPVTNAIGTPVTNQSGKPVTEQVVLPQNPNRPQGGGLVLGTSNVAVTDGVGATAVDNKGEVITTIVEITSNPVKVDPAAISWKASLGGTEADYFSCIDSLKDGGFITANVTNSKNGDFGKFDELGYATPYTVLVKYNDNGSEVWSKAIGSKRGLHVVTDVVATADGGFYAVGYGKNIGGVNGKGYYDSMVYKYDNKGNEVWHKVFGTSTVDVFNAAKLTSDGGIVIAGSVGNNDGDAAGFNKPVNQSAACVVKYDANGNLVWKNILGGNRDAFNDVCEAKDGSIFCVGNFASNELFQNLGKTDGGIVKLTADGKYVATMPISGTGNELFNGISPCKDGGVIAVGRSNSSDIDNPESMFVGNTGSRGGYDAYLVKVSSSLSLNFIKPFRGQYDDNLVDIVERADGTFVATGESNSSTRDFNGITTRGGDDIVVASFDKFGNLTWARSFGGTADESANAICLDPNGGYVIAGRTLSKNIDMNGIAQYVNGKSVGVIAKFPE